MEMDDDCDDDYDGDRGDEEEDRDEDLYFGEEEENEWQWTYLCILNNESHVHLAGRFGFRTMYYITHLLANKPLSHVPPLSTLSCLGRQFATSWY